MIIIAVMLAVLLGAVSMFLGVLLGYALSERSRNDSEVNWQ